VIPSKKTVNSFENSAQIFIYVIRLLEMRVYRHCLGRVWRPASKPKNLREHPLIRRLHTNSKTEMIAIPSLQSTIDQVRIHVSKIDQINLFISKIDRLLFLNIAVNRFSKRSLLLNSVSKNAPILDHLILFLRKD